MSLVTMAHGTPPNPGQVLQVYAKLQTFLSAKHKIIDILQNSVLKDQNIQIKGGDFHDMEQECLHRPVIAKTAMIVIDVRQARTLITPERRDPAVDHWDELDKLYSLSNPPGSILLVLYGDEKSRKLEEVQVLGREWSTIWKFNDKIAYELGAKGVCFSLHEDFNEKQRDAIRQYLDQVALLPVPKGEVNILLLGDKDPNKEFVHRFMDGHPLLRNSDTQNYQTFTAKTYVPFNFKISHSQPSSNSTYIASEVKMSPIKVCNNQTGNIKNIVENQLSSYNLSRLGIPDITTPSSQRHIFDPSVTFDRLLLVCHCDKCFISVYTERTWITTYARKELGKLGITLTGDVLPVVDDYPAELVQTETVAYVSDKIAKTGDGFIDEKRGRLQKLDSVSKLKIYTWYACITQADSECKTSVRGSESPLKRWLHSLRPRKTKYLIMAIVIIILLFIIIIVSSERDEHIIDVIGHTTTLINTTDYSFTTET